jgi:hypothetical protein
VQRAAAGAEGRVTQNRLNSAPRILENPDKLKVFLSIHLTPSHGVFSVKLIHFGIVHAPGRLDPKREPVFAMQP